MCIRDSLSPNNLLKPSDGGLVAVPSQDMILGVYYLTKMCIRDRYDVADAISIVKKNATAKFDETIELHLRTGCDGRHAEQQILSLIHIYFSANSLYVYSIVKP